jgi:hypothetical protein
VIWFQGFGDEGSLGSAVEARGADFVHGRSRQPSGTLARISHQGA